MTQEQANIIYATQGMQRLVNVMKENGATIDEIRNTVEKLLKGGERMIGVDNGWTRRINALEQENAELRKERDAAVADIVLVAEKSMCPACRHDGKPWDTGVCLECDEELSRNNFKGNFEWRGVTT